MLQASFCLWSQKIAIWVSDGDKKLLSKARVLNLTQTIG